MDQDAELETLRRQIRTETALVTELAADAAQVEWFVDNTKKPFFGSSYSFGLLLGIPFWWLAFIFLDWWAAR